MTHRPDPQARRAHNRCPREPDAVAYLQAELSVAATRQFAAHLDRCPACREFVADASVLLAALAQHPRAVMGRGARGIAPPVTSSDRSHMPPASRARLAGRARPRWPARAIAATAVMGVLGWITLTAWQGGPEAPTEIAATTHAPPSCVLALTAEAEALQWLAEHQEVDGGWRAERWGGAREYDLGLTALATLAFLHATPTMRVEPDRLQQVIERAVHHLLAQQRPDGVFGAPGPATREQHGVITVALLEHHARYGRGADPNAAGPRLPEALARALNWIVTQQDGAPQAQVRALATCWPLQALLLGRGLGWPGLDEAIERALRTLPMDDCEVAAWPGLSPGLSPGTPLAAQRSPETVGALGRAPSWIGAYCLLLADDVRLAGAPRRAALIATLERTILEHPWQEDLYQGLFLVSALAALAPETAERALTGHAATAQKLARVARRMHSDATAEHTDEYTDEYTVTKDPHDAVGGKLYSTTLAALILQSPQRTRSIAGWVAGG